MTTRNYDEWTIERWRLEPQLGSADVEFADRDDRNPPLWKDLTLASIIAALFWTAVAVLLA